MCVAVALSDLRCLEFCHFVRARGWVCVLFVRAESYWACVRAVCVLCVWLRVPVCASVSVSVPSVLVWP